MASMVLYGPQQARIWMKACCDVSTGLKGREHLWSEARSHPDSSCLQGEKLLQINGYWVVVRVCMCSSVCVRACVLLCLCSWQYTVEELFW